MLDVDHLDAAERSAAKISEWSHRHAADVEAAYIQDGYSLGQIAQRLGLTVEGVRKRLRTRGVELRPKGRGKKSGHG